MIGMAGMILFPELHSDLLSRLPRPLHLFHKYGDRRTVYRRRSTSSRRYNIEVVQQSATPAP